MSGIIVGGFDQFSRFDPYFLFVLCRLYLAPFSRHEPFYDLSTFVPVRYFSTPYVDSDYGSQSFDPYFLLAFNQGYITAGPGAVPNAVPVRDL